MGFNSTCTCATSRDECPRHWADDVKAPLPTTPVVGARVYFAGNMGANAAYGFIVGPEESGYLTVRWDSGRVSREPVQLFGMARGLKVIS